MEDKVTVHSLERRAAFTSGGLPHLFSIDVASLISTLSVGQIAGKVHWLRLESAGDASSLFSAVRESGWEVESLEKYETLFKEMGAKARLQHDLVALAKAIEGGLISEIWAGRGDPLVVECYAELSLVIAGDAMMRGGAQRNPPQLRRVWLEV